jgi:hypothetical protein
MRIGTVDLNRLRGVSDKGFGFGKELLGVLVGSERLEREGDAQQERAAAELRSLRSQLTAEREDAKAKAAEHRQRAAQHQKEAG